VLQANGQSVLTELGGGEQCGDGECRDGDELGPGGLFPVTGHDEHDGGHGVDSGGFVTMGNYLFYNSATNDLDITDANPTMCMCRRFTWT